MFVGKFLGLGEGFLECCRPFLWFGGVLEGCFWKTFYLGQVKLLVLMIIQAPSRYVFCCSKTASRGKSRLAMFLWKVVSFISAQFSLLVSECFPLVCYRPSFIHVELLHVLLAGPFSTRPSLANSEEKHQAVLEAEAKHIDLLVAWLIDSEGSGFCRGLVYYIVSSEEVSQSRCWQVVCLFLFLSRI